MNQLSHSEVERIIDEQERELDRLIREFNLIDDGAGTSRRSDLTCDGSAKRGFRWLWRHLWGRSGDDS